MPYTTYYTANLTNELEQEVVCLIQNKNGLTVTPFNLPVVSMRLQSSSDDQSIYACIITKKLELTVWADIASPISWETFLTDDYDTWKITVTIDGEIFFIGFISPDEGGAPFQDHPYEVIITATDGIGLLKGYDLTKIDGTKFTTQHKLIDYLSAALYKTKLNLPIRTYCTYSHSELPNKYDDIKNDFFNQFYLNWRSFLKSVDAYDNCYDTIKNILDGWCHIEQYKGKWQIVCLSDRQFVTSSLYYVDYDYNGVAQSGGLDVEGVAKVGKYQLIYPIYPVNENQRIRSKFANRVSKYTFDYNVPDELILNLKLSKLGVENGNQSNVTNPDNGQIVGTKQKYVLPDWTAYNGQIQPQYRTSTTTVPLVVIEKDNNDVEVQRYFEINPDPSSQITALRTFIVNNNNDFFVEEGDYINVSISYRTQNDINDSSRGITFFATLALLKDGTSGASATDWWTLRPPGTYTNNSWTNWRTAEGFNWINTFGNFFVQTQESNITSDWRTVSTDNVVIPANGSLYLFLGSGFHDNITSTQYKDIRIEYLPSYGKSPFSIKGDYHSLEKTTAMPDSYDKKIFLSDSPRRSIKGCLLVYLSGIYRLCGKNRFYHFPYDTEDCSFKKLVNLGHFNHTYRRMYEIEGDFTSLMYNTITDETTRMPIGFHKLYRFADMSPNRDFVLVPNLDMDLVSGNIQATFHEVKGASGDGTQTGDIEKEDFIFK